MPHCPTQESNPTCHGLKNAKCLSKLATKHCTYQNWRCHPILQQSASSRVECYGSTWASAVHKRSWRTSLIWSQWIPVSLKGFPSPDTPASSQVVWRQWLSDKEEAGGESVLLKSQGSDFSTTPRLECNLKSPYLRVKNCKTHFQHPSPYPPWGCTVSSSVSSWWSL